MCTVVCYCALLSAAVHVSSSAHCVCDIAALADVVAQTAAVRALSCLYANLLLSLLCLLVSAVASATCDALLPDRDGVFFCDRISLFEEELALPSTFYLVDGLRPEILEAFTVLTTSPRHEMYYVG